MTEARFRVVALFETPYYLAFAIGYCEDVVEALKIAQNPAEWVSPEDSVHLLTFARDEGLDGGTDEMINELCIVVEIHDLQAVPHQRVRLESHGNFHIGHSAEEMLIAWGLGGDQVKQFLRDITI